MKRSVIAVIALLVIAGSLVFLWLTRRNPPGRLAVALFQGLGEALATETARCLNGQGQVVILTLDASSRQPAASIPVESFIRALAAYPGLSVRARESIPVPSELTVSSSLISAARFLQVLDKHASADALVSFAGVPYFTDTQLAQLPAQRPRIIVSESMSPQLKELIEKDVVQAAVVHRGEAPPTERPPRTPREAFDQYFLVVTAKNIGALPGTRRPPR